MKIKRVAAVIEVDELEIHVLIPHFSDPELLDKFYHRPLTINEKYDVLRMSLRVQSALIQWGEF